MADVISPLWHGREKEDPVYNSKLNRAIGMGMGATETDKRWAANFLVKHMTDGAIDSVDGAMFNNMAPMAADAYLAKAQALAKSGDPTSMLTDNAKGFYAIDESDFEKQYEYAKAHKAEPAFEESVGKAFGKVASYGRLTSDERKWLTDEENASHEDVAPPAFYDKPTGMSGAMADRYVGLDEDDPARTAKLKELKTIADKRKTVAEFKQQLAQENVWCAYLAVKPMLSGKACALVDAAIGYDPAGEWSTGAKAVKIFTPNSRNAIADMLEPKRAKLLSDFTDLVETEPEQAEKIAPLLHMLQKNQGDNTIAGDMMRQFVGMFGNITKGMTDSIVHLAERFIVDGETYQSLREREALFRRAFEPKMDEHGPVGRALVGLASTIPYMAASAVPYAGPAAIWLYAADEFEKKVVDEGGDVSSPAFVASRFAFAAMWAMIERAQVISPLKGVTEAKRAIMYANMYKSAKAFANVAMKQAINLGGEITEEGLQAAVEDGFVAWGLERDVASAAAEGFARDFVGSIGSFLPLMAFEAHASHVTYRRGGLSAEEVVRANQALKGIAQREAVTSEDAQRFGEDFGTMAQTWANAGEDSKARHKALIEKFGLNDEQAAVANSVLGQMYSAVRGDADAERKFFAGAEMKSVGELLTEVFGKDSSSITDNGDGTITFEGTLGDKEGGSSVKFTVNPNAAVKIDVDDKAVAPSIVNALNKMGYASADLTVQKWLELPLDVRQKMVDDAKLSARGYVGGITVTDANGDSATVTDGDLYNLTANIALDGNALPVAVFHETMHAMLKFVEKASPNLFSALCEKYAPISDFEKVNEEVLADNFRDYLTKKVTLVGYEDDLFDKLYNFILELRGVAENHTGMFLVADAKDAQDKLFNAVLSGDFKDVPGMDTGAAETTAETTAETATEEATAETMAGEGEAETAGTQEAAAGVDWGEKMENGKPRYKVGGGKLKDRLTGETRPMTTEEVREHADWLKSEAVNAVKAERGEEAADGVGTRWSVGGVTPAEDAAYMDAVKRGDANERTTLLAPNGKRSNLTNALYHLVRTKRFKDWFGDWEIASLFNLATKAWDDKSYIGKFVFAPSQKLGDKLKGLLGHEVNEIVITADSVRHMKNHHGDAAYEAARGQTAMTPEDVAVLPYVLNNFDVAERNSTYDKKLGNKSVDFYKRINGVSVVATISMGKGKQFVVSGWKVLSAASMSPTVAPKLNALNDADIDIVQKKIAEIKRAAKDCSKVVDENGEPMVVYHDTNSKRYVNRETGEDWDLLDWKKRQEWEYRDDWDEYWIEQDFYTFDRRNSRTTNEMPAYFFTPNADPYHEYGSRRIAAFLNLKNPIVNPIIPNRGERDGAGADYMDELRKQGYDGFIRKYDGKIDETNAFDSNQIKSADPVTYDDAGNVIPLSQRFDPDNNDIRYSIGGLYTGSAADYAERVPVLDKDGNVTGYRIDNGPSLQKIGTGEGEQVYGWGLYASNRRGVADTYAEEDAKRKDFAKKRGNKTKTEIAAGSRLRTAYDRIVDYPYRPFNAPPPSKDEILKQAIKAVEFDISHAENGGLLKDYISVFKETLKELKEHGDEYSIPSKYVYEQTFFTNRAEGDESHLLNWYEPVSRKNVSRIVSEIERTIEKNDVDPRDLELMAGSDWRKSFDGLTGQEAYEKLDDICRVILDEEKSDNHFKDTSLFLARADIDGIKYPVDSYGTTVKDGDEAGWNYVSFRDDNIRVDHKWVDGVPRYSIGTLSDGRKFVDVDTDQALFDNAPKSEWAKIARRVIRDRFRGKVIGIKPDNAYVSRDSENEYAYPAKRRGVTEEVRGAKLRASPELDNLMRAAEFKNHKDDDGRHPDAVGGWDEYGVIFRVGKKFFDGTISVKITGNGRVFNDVTKIVEDTERTVGDHGKPLPESQGVPTPNIVPQSGAEVNGGVRYSVSAAMLDWADSLPDASTTRASIEAQGPAMRFSPNSYMTAFAVTDKLNGIERPDADYEKLAKALGASLSAKEAGDMADKAIAQGEKDFRAILRKTARAGVGVGEIARMIEEGTMPDYVSQAFMGAARSGAKMGAAAQAAWFKAMNRMKEFAPSYDLDAMRSAMGVDITKTMADILPERFAMEDEEKAGGEKKERSEKKDNGEFVGPPTFETWEEWEKNKAAREQVYTAVLAAYREWLAARKAEAAAKEAERKAKAEEKAAKAVSEATDIEEDEETSGIEEDEDEEDAIPAMPREVLEAHGVDLANADEFASFMRTFVAASMLARRGEELTQDALKTVFNDEVSLETYRKSMKAQLREMSDALLDPDESGRAKTKVERMISDIPTTATANTVERRSSDIMAFIQRNAVRQTRKQLMEECAKMVKEMAVKGAKFDAMEKDIKRKVRGEHEAYCRYLLKVLKMSQKAVAREADRLQAIVDGRKEAYEGIDGADVTTDVEFHRAYERLQALSIYGGLKDSMPAVIKAKTATLRQWLETERYAHEERWGAFQAECDRVKDLVLDAVKKSGRKYTPKNPGESGGLSGLAQNIYQDVLSSVRQRLEDMMVGASIEERENAISAITDILAEGEQQLAFLKSYFERDTRQAFEDACAATGAKVKDVARMLDEYIPEELNDRLVTDAQKTRMTWDNAMQLYVSLLQTATYGGNIQKHGRAGQAELIRDAAPPELIRLADSFRKLYAERREILSKVVSDVTGMPIYNPDPLYMPVRMYTGAREGLDVKVNSWSPLNKSLTPRVKNGLDFDLSAGMVGMFAQRQVETARAVAFGARGLKIRSMLARKEVLDAMIQVHGKVRTQKLIEQLTDTLSDGWRGDAAKGGLMGVVRTMGVFNTYAALSGNLVTMLKQMTSASAWTPMLRGGYRELIDHIVNFDMESARELIDSPAFVARYGSESFRAMVVDALTDKRDSLIARCYKAGMTVVQIGDFVPGILVGTGYYKTLVAEEMKQNPGANMDEVKERAKTLTWALIEETQQTSRLSGTPHMLRRWGILGKQVSKFATSPLQQAAHEMHAFRMWREAARLGNRETADECRRKFINAVISNHVIMPILMQAVATLFGMALGEEPPEKEKLMGNIILDMMTGPASRIFIVGSIFKKAGAEGLKAVGMKPDVYNDNTFSSAQMLERLVQKGWITAKDIAELDFDSFGKDFMDMVGVVNAPIRSTTKAARNYLGEEEGNEYRGTSVAPKGY